MKLTKDEKGLSWQNSGLGQAKHGSWSKTPWLVPEVTLFVGWMLCKCQECWPSAGAIILRTTAHQSMRPGTLGKELLEPSWDRRPHSGYHIPRTPLSPPLRSPRSPAVDLSCFPSTTEMVTPPTCVCIYILGLVWLSPPVPASCVLGFSCPNIIHKLSDQRPNSSYCDQSVNLPLKCLRTFPSTFSL